MEEIKLDEAVNQTVLLRSHTSGYLFYGEVKQYGPSYSLVIGGKGRLEPVHGQDKIYRIDTADLVHR